MRDKLITLIDQAEEECKHTPDCKGCSGYKKGSLCIHYHVANHLLANGIIVPPCNIGDTVYRAIKGITKVYTGEVVEIFKGKSGVYCRLEHVDSTGYRCHGGVCRAEDFGETVFLTREEAEIVLKEINK